MRRQILMIISISATIAIFFLWQESISFHYKINDQKVANYAIVIGSLLTGISAFLLFRQLAETVKSRNAVRQPELYPQDVQFYTEDEPTGALPIPTFHAFDNNNHNKIPLHLPSVELRNIGLGVAKKIRAEWIYDRDAVKRYIAGIYNEADNGNDEYNFNFIAENGISRLFLPSFYLKTCGEQKNINHFDFFEPIKEDPRPPLTLQLSFLDIYNNSYQKKFIVDVDGFLQYIGISFDEILE